MSNYRFIAEKKNKGKTPVGEDSQKSNKKEKDEKQPENSVNNKDDSKLICVPFENEIIAEYRYKNALDKAKVSLPNVSQQRTVFEEQLRRIGLNHA